MRIHPLEKVDSSSTYYNHFLETDSRQTLFVHLKCWVVWVWQTYGTNEVWNDVVVSLVIRPIWLSGWIWEYALGIVPSLHNFTNTIVSHLIAMVSLIALTTLDDLRKKTNITLKILTYMWRGSTNFLWIV